MAAVKTWLAIAIFVFLPVGYLVECSYKPQLLLNETTRHLYQYRDMRQRNNEVSLIPGLFQGGEPKQQVELQLLSAGLQTWSTSYGAMPPGAVSTQRYRLSAGVRDMACGSELFVRIGYDESDQLTSATISQGGACL
ncbi:hypothetical protein [Devosia sp. CAU 1758]